MGPVRLRQLKERMDSGEWLTTPLKENQRAF